MMKKQPILLLMLLLLLMASADSQCPVLCDTCPPGASTCSYCYSSFEDTSIQSWTASGTCPCPDGYFMNTTTKLCLFCPVTCITCTDQNTCISCIPGYEINQLKQCAKRYSNPGQWLTMDVALDLSQQKLSKYNYEGFYLYDYVPTLNISNMIRSCESLNSQLFFGMYSFDYNTQVVKSYFGLAHHDWIQVKFQFVAINRWTATNMVLEINDRESYRLSDLEGVYYNESKSYTSGQRHRNFCFGTSSNGDADNLGFISVYLPHQESMLKIRIRTDLSNLTTVPSGTDYQSLVYFGLSNLFIRSGTCPTNCKKCAGPNVCIECISPYVTTGTGSCECNLAIAQLTETGRCVKKCQPGYIFTKLGTIPESRCILCSLLEDRMRNCLTCNSVNNAYQCTACLQGFVLNSTGYCVDSCPTSTYTLATYDVTLKINRIQCVACGVNCMSCSFGICTQCANNTFYQEGSCVQICTLGFYLDMNRNVCMRCPSNCANCTSKTTCAQCIGSLNFTLSSGLCVPQCNSTSTTCATTVCHSSCATCFGSTQTSCLSCALSTNLLQNYKCVSSCSVGYFSFDSSQCLPCNYPCSACTNFQTCTSCQIGYVLSQQACTRECPLNFYPDSSRICKLCPINCKTCYNDTVCLTCINNYIMFQGKCVIATPCSQRDGFYFDQKTLQCLPCPENCSSCYKDLCLRCRTTSVLDNGKCMPECSEEKTEYQEIVFDNGTQTNLTSRVCKWKDILCNSYTMVNGSSVCSSCIFMNPMLVLLPTNKCSFTCPLGQVKVEANNLVTCQACPVNCVECLSNLTCVKCDTSYVLNPVRTTAGAVQCLSSCPQGYTSDGYQCLACKTNCKTCDITGRCSECLTSFTLTLANSCVNNNCNLNQYSSGSSCLNCPTNCPTCNSLISCSSCGVSSGVQLYLQNTICQDKCNDGFWPDQLGFQCKKCSSQCLKCVSATECTVCLAGYYLLMHPIQRISGTRIGTCVRECPIGYYNSNPLLSTDKQIAVCAFCSPNCMTCYGPTEDQCLSCYGSFKLVNSRCVELCPFNQYQDSTGHCDWCHPSCMQCTGPAEFQCKTCSQGFYLYRSTCYPYSCPGSTYPVDYDSRVCQLCQWGCQVCTNPYNCSVCTGGFYLYDGWCYLSCPANTQPYLDLVYQGYRCGTCSKTWANCLECANSTCQRCALGYFLSPNSTTPCVSSCPYGFYAQLSPIAQCRRCPSNCLTCVSQQTCTSCQQFYILSNGQCSTRCPKSKFYSRYTNSCTSCSSNCQDCNSTSQCQNCIDNYYLYTEYQSGSTISYCVSDCGDYRYEDQDSKTCQNCTMNCKYCNAFDNCTRCNSGFTLVNGYCYQNNTNPTCNVSRCAKCLNAQVCETCEIPLFLWIAVSSSGPVSFCAEQCPIGMWTAGRTCHLCNTTCVKCKRGANDCEQCIAGWFLYNRRCYKDCPRGTYQNSTTGNCTRCPQNCFDCVNSTYCKTCKSGKRFYKGQCYDSCPWNTYEQGSSCFECSSTCKKCRSLNYCLECKAGYVLFEGQCRLQCPSTHYLKLDDGALRCIKCRYPCSTCKSESQCTTCSDDYAFSGEQNKCVDDCGERRYAKNASINGYVCTQCEQKCKNCLNSTYCLECDDQRTLFKGNCLENCPIGLFKDNSTESCRSCSPNCLACKAYDACIQCHNQTVLYKGKCIDLCPSGTYKTIEYSYELRTSTNLCKPCQSPCKDCNGSSIFNCQSCIPTMYLYQNVCVGSCPSGYYPTTMQLFTPTSVTVNLIKNGDFSRTKCVGDWCLYSLSGYNNQVDGWIPDDEIEIGYGRIYSSYLGAERVLELAPNKNTCVKQLIPNLVAGDYLLQFTWSARAGRTFTDCQFKAYFNGQQVKSVTPADYLTHTESLNLSLSTTSSSTELKFCSVGGDNNSYGAVLKDIVLVKKTTEMTSFDTTLVNTVQMKCVKCPVGCVTCTSKDLCTSCVAGWTLNSIGQCRPNTNCTLPNCEICQFVNATNVCWKCINPYYLIRNTLIPTGFATIAPGTTFTCVLNCPVNTFKSANFNCLPCPVNCTACSYTDCSACKPGFYLFDTTCVDTCPTGYTSNTTSNTCTPTPCLYKNSLSLCQKCISPYFLYKGQCVNVCPSQTYQQDSSCIDCDPIVSHCLTCTSLTTCTSCISGYFLYLGVCVSKCPLGYFMTTSASGSKGCALCESSLIGCLSCQNSTICTECKFPYFLSSSGQCLLNCPAGTFRSPYSQQCLPCSLAISDSCLACSNQTTCTSCNNRTVLFNGKCISQCPNGFFLSSTSLTCQPCNSKCFTCTSSTNCTLCKQGFFLMSTNTSNVITLSCVEACPSGYFETLNSTCQLCKAQCLTCNMDSCLSCPTGKFLFQGKCLTTCPDHYYGLNGNCLVCNSQCKTCSNSASSCLTCYSGYIYQSTTKTCLKNCTSVTQYYDPLTYSCQNCSTDCQTCYGPRYDQCLTCKDPLSLTDGLCSLECPSGYYRDSNSVCKICDPTKCLACSGSDSNCTSCLYPKVLVIYNNNQNGKCDVNCGSGFYFDKIDLSCKACSVGCVSCVDALSCLVCDNTKFLYLGQCITTCPVGYVAVSTLSQTTCQKCPANCAQCTYSTTTSTISCTQCISPLFLYNNTCYTTCPSSTFLLNTACQACPDRCQTCTSATICLSCKFPYVFNPLTSQCLDSCPTGYENINSICKQIKTCSQMIYNGICYAQCPLGTFATAGSSQCMDCPISCAQCLASDFCTSCKTGFYMYIDQNQLISCVASCPAKTYLNNKYCTTCPAPCETCIANSDNTVSCLTCLTGYSLDGKCLSTCPSGYYPLNGACTKCMSKCLTCDASGCLTCANSLYTAPTCESSTVVCTSGQFVSQLNNSCTNCDASCLTCYGPSAGECKACKNVSSTVYYLFGSSCLTDCPDGYMKDSNLNKCTACSITNCKNCSLSSTSCTTCNPNYILFSNSSTTKCILSCSDLTTATKVFIPSPSNPSICISCDTQVANCLDCYYSSSALKTICMTCSAGYYLLPNGTCTNACSSGWYVSQSKYCLPCGSYCSICTSDSVCQTCVSGYSLYLGLCVSACPIGFYSNNGVCTQCSSNCRTCTSTQCTQCLTPYALDTSNLCTLCIPGYFMSSSTSKCQICSANCLQCQSSQAACTKCAQPLFLLNTQCLSTCPTGYYGNTIPVIDTCSTCDSLVTNCASCVSGGCLKCKDTFYLQPIPNSNSYSCVATCTAGYYPNTANMICIKCNLANCLECSSLTQCTKCNTGFYALQGSCYSTCPQGYAPSTTNGVLTCVPCKTGCKSCPVSVNTCTLCDTNLQIDNNGNCVPVPNSCLATQYLNTLGSCSPCHDTCLTCFGGLRINCLTCRTPQYQLQSDNSCMQMCLSSQYYDTILSQCKPCTDKYGPYCTYCDSQACSSCSQGVLSSDSQSCITTCTGATYQYNGVCTNCPQYCKTCNSSTYCSECISSSYFLYNNLCYDTCPIMTQSYNGTCRPCDDKCLVCVGTTTNCSSCKSIYKLLNGATCVDACPSGTFETTVAGVNNIVCQQCMSPCGTCSGSATNCTSCIPDIMNLYQHLYQNQCVAVCPSQTYVNTADNACYACQYPCATCISSPTKCTSCATGFTYLSSSNSCSNQCSPGTYIYTNPSTSVTSCVPCSVANCRTCDATQCYKCQPNFFGTLSATNATISCTLTCPDYYFPDLLSQTCLKCKDLCITCNFTTTCQKCVTPYFLYQDQCLSSCPDQTYQILNAGGFKCQDCGSLCSVCVDNVTCTICQDNAYLLNGICYSSCPVRYYERNSDKTCQSCSIQNCGKCTLTQCQRCADGFFGTVDASGQIVSCVTDCGDLFFENPLTAMCERCLDGCKKCQNSTTCQQCISPKSLFINGNSQSCVRQCPEYYFSDATTNPIQCRRCQANCLQCFTSEKCYECKSNFTLFYNSSTVDTCITDCPIAYYQTSTAQGYAYCQACSSHCLKCISSHECTTCQDTHTLVNSRCIPHNCVNCDSCDESVSPAICKNCTLPYYLYKVKCMDNCPVYYFNAVNETTQVRECQKCIQNCINCTTNNTCDACIPDYIFVKGDGCVNEAVHNYGQAANMSGFTSNITQTMAKIYMGTSVGPVAFGQMTTTYFNLQFTQFMLFHPTGGNPEMTQFLNSLQTMSLTNGGTTVTNSSTPAQVQARRRLLAAKSTYFTESFIQVNASIFYLMFAFIGAYAAIWVFQKFVTEACRVSCNQVWFYLDAVCEFMQKRFKWIYFDFIMWLSYIPFLYFAVMQLKQFSFTNGSQGFSSILAIIIIATYPLYPVFICYLMKSHYSEISMQPGEQEIKQTLTEMSLSPFLTKVKRPIKNIVIPFEEQDFSFRKYFNRINFILIYYPLKYVRKFAFVLVAALVPDPVNMVATLIAINIAFIIYMIALRPRVMPYIVFDLVIEFVLLSFEVFLLVYLLLDGPKVAMMSIVTHAVGFITANLSLITAIILNLIAYYKIFLCIKDLISHLRVKAAERNQAYNKFEVEKKFLDPDSDLYIEKEIGKLKRLNDDDDTDEDDSDLRLSGNARRLLENLGQKDLLLNGIDPIKYIKDLTKKQNFGIEQKQIALKYVNEDDVTDSDDDSLDENAMEIAKKLQMNEKNLALNKIHPVKFAKELTKDDAPLEKQYKKFDEKHIDSKLAKKINDDGLTDSDDDSIDQNVMNIARNLNEKQLALNEINPVKFLKEDTKKDAPLEDRYKKFDEKNVDKKIARVINEDNATDSDDSEIDQEMHDLAKKLQLNEKQLAFNEINPVKFFKQETKKDAPLEEQYQKFDEKHMDKRLAQKINEENNTDSESDQSVDEHAHHLARKLNLNEKQLAFNEINPLKFFKEETKKDAPLQEQYENFDEKNVDRKLQKIINDDGDTDSEDEETTEENEGYRIARQLKLNEKQLAANNLNPIKVMQDEAKQDIKLKNIMQKFDEKDIDMKVARIINDNGETSSQESDQDEEDAEKMVVARQLKLDEKELAANNINPVKYAKETTKIDPVTNEPKINQAILSFAMDAILGGEKPRKKLLDKELRLRNEMKREVSENEHTDSDEEENKKLSKFSKERLKNMSEKDMMMQGLDPIKAVQKITKEAIAKKMAKKLNGNNKVYDDEIPDFKVSNKPNSNPIKDVIRSTQEKLKESTKKMLGAKKEKGNQLPSEENLNQKGANMKLIDSESDQETQNLTHKPIKMTKSTNVKVGENKLKNVGRREVENDWDDQFEVVDKKKAQKSAKPQNIIVQEQKKQQRISLVDPNNKIKNFDQEFSEQYIQSQQSSEAALNHKLKHTYEEDLESINLEHQKSNKLIRDQEVSKKIINLDEDKSMKPQPLRRDGESKQSRSQLNMKTEKHVRQDEMFNEFEEFEDLGQIQAKEINEKKYQRKDNQRIPKEINKKDTEPQVFEDDEISSVEQKEIKEAKFKRNQITNVFKNSELPKQVTESMVFQQSQQPSSRNQVKSDRTIEGERYSELVKKNKANIKVPEGFKNQAFQEVEYEARPSNRGISRHKSKINSDNESESGEYSNVIRKQRMEGRQRTRSRNGNQNESNKIQSKRSSQVLRNQKQAKLKVQKIKIENMSENEDEIERVDI